MLTTVHTSFLTGCSSNTDLILPQQPAALPSEQASPQPRCTLQPQDAQSQIYKNLKQHFLMNWTYVKPRLWQNNFLVIIRRQQTGKGTLQIFTAVPEKNPCCLQLEYCRIILTCKTYGKKHDKRYYNNLAPPLA